MTDLRRSTTVDAQAARTRLEQLLQELDTSLAVLETSGSHESSELSSIDQHPADAATDLTDADREDSSKEVVEEQRERVVAALARVDAGTYGTCVECGQPIPDERLDALPEAERDVAHQQEFEAAR